MRFCEAIPATSTALIILLMLGAGNAHAERPKQTSALGLALGATPDSVLSSLSRQYPSCDITRSIYHAVPGDAAQVPAGFTLNLGTLSECTGSPTGSDLTDAIDARFVHPEIERDQPLYYLNVRRAYPDVAYAQPPRIRHPLEKLRAELFRTYGRPTDERREKAVSASANLAAGLGVGKNMKREDQLIRYLWSAKGRLAESETDDSPECDCGPRYVKVKIEVSRSPSTIPKNQDYVLSLSLFIEDATLRARQDPWNAQWQQQKK